MSGMESVGGDVSMRVSSLASTFCLQIFECQELPSSSSYHCEVFFYMNKLGSSDILEGPNTSWQLLIRAPMNAIKRKETENNRSYKYEYIDVIIYEHTTKVAPGVLCAKGRIPLSDIHLREPMWIYLTKAAADEDEISRLYAGKMFVNMSLENLATHDDIAPAKFITLRDILDSNKFPQYGHLFMDYDCSSATHTGSFIVPGPKCGEVVHDFYDTVLWELCGPNNLFGDKDSINLIGNLTITDLRIIFVPYRISSYCFPSVHADPNAKPPIFHDISDLHLIRKFTVQIFLGTIYATDFEMLDPHHTVLYVETRGWRRLFEFTIQKSNALNFEAAGDIDCDGSMYYSIHETSYPLLKGAGLDTKMVSPSSWCLRVVPFIQWKVRSNVHWMDWGRCMWNTYHEYFLGDLYNEDTSRTWLCSSKDILRNEFYRLNIEKSGFKLTEENSLYGICPTYPSVLCFPSKVDTGKVHLAAEARSMSRLPTLVWLHPHTHASLYRSSQPSNNPLRSEIDKSFIKTLKESSPFDLPLRICDARPFINATANKLKGKGFENVEKLGGKRIVALRFMHIENIHIMRESLRKLQEHFANDNSSLNNAYYESKWPVHIASVLRGAVSLADSLHLGHPSLVHCSDGWDRTPQLSSLAQILLDPYFRTIKGFIVLIEKEWTSFGHKFSSRIHSSSDEESPIFLQFLDCVHQLLHQFPTEFEFTERLLVVLAQMLPTGCLLSFICDSELSRNNLVEKASARGAERLHIQFARLPVFIEMLYRSNFACYLISANYHPPEMTRNRVKYIKPSYMTGDVIIWKDGLLAYNQFFCRAYCDFSSTRQESTASLMDNCKRIVNYSYRNARYLPEYQNDTLSIAVTDLYEKFPNFLRRDDHFVACSSMNTHLLTRESYRFDSQLDVFNQEYIASLRIILWYKSIKMSQKLRAVGTSWFWNNTAGLNSMYIRACTAIYRWYIKNRALRTLILSSKMKFCIRDMVVEIIEDALAPLDSLEIDEDGRIPFFNVSSVDQKDLDLPTINSPDWIPPGHYRREFINKISNGLKSMFSGFVSTTRKGVERANIKLGLQEKKDGSWNFRSTSRGLNSISTGVETVWQEEHSSSSGDDIIDP